MTQLALSNLIESTAHRTDSAFLAEVDGFITRASAKIGRDLRSRANLTDVPQIWVGGAYALPSGFQEVLSVTVANDPDALPLVPVSKNELDQWPVTGGTNPCVYTIVDGDMLARPDTEADLTLHYYTDPAPALVADLDTNAVLEQHEQLYLAAAMTYAAEWMQDTEMLAYWKQEYNSEYMAINQARRTQRQPQGRSDYVPIGGTFGV